ncbi:MAG: N-6 DNA methylase [Desulfobacterales bacterium]|uniref:N-6 DNA methylase n=1 Tax=Candidatus Desulfatibia profunda TaxID=2841695 RepID=A0A8J6NRQ2_9BACT|nr:N-6 DNA methylase [Candidatus Desulfatibia profunda]MBL7179939.1 N-6 DNA methylase [Desulfobacterales bacterium]
MNMQDLLNCLEYSESSYYLTGSRLNAHPAYSHAFRLAKEKCGLDGVYTLQGNDSNIPLCQNLLPIIYVCKANSEADAAEFHKLVWNQNIVPFLLVETPKTFRLYPSFNYNPRVAEKKDQSILVVAKTANAVLSNLSELKASAIDSGAIWQKWSEVVTQEKRVDTKLLKSLKSLSDWLQKHNLPRNAAHALIGKYVFLHYLKDRDILSDRKFSQWKIEKNTVFSRNATLVGFLNVIERLDDWLNGTLFPISEEGIGSPSLEHIQMVAGTFAGDDPKTRQMHLDFKAYDFQQIPIETLSMVYQQFLHAEGKGRGQGAYYTPIHLVNFILDELDAKVPLRKGMRVCDPACGSGAFLVRCYRRLIEREVEQSPEKHLSPFDLRELLTNHIYGIDVDEDACGVTELSLTLTLLDYVDPPDLEKPAYSNFVLPSLRDQNIFCCEEGFFDPKSIWQIEKPKEGYDWIIGNPPWKQLNPKKLEKGDKAALAWIKRNKNRFPVSGNQLAEAFAWEASQHLSEQGLVGLLLPAGTLFKTNAEKFRKSFFSTLNVWCVVNFANLRHLLFQGAKNPAAAFFYSCLQKNGDSVSRIITYAPFAVNQLARYEANRRKRGMLWTVIVNANEIREILPAEAATGSSQPWKLAMWGSSRDRFLLNSLDRRFPPLSEFKKKHGLKIHPGLELRTKETDEPVEYLPEIEGKKELDITVLSGYDDIFAFPEQALRRIDSDRAWVRKRGGKIPLQICYPPHIIVHAARKFAVFSNEFFVVPPRQIGIAGKTSQVDLLKALALYLNSDFAVYQQFLSSTFWGIERDRPDKTDLEKLPIPLDNLSDKGLSDWARLYDELAEASLKYFSAPKEPLFDGSEKPPDPSRLKEQLNDFVYTLLGINRTERWVIEDLLLIRKKLNEGKLAREAINPANKDEINRYAKVLKAELDNFLDADVKDQHRVTVFYDHELAIVKVEHPHTPPAGPAITLKVEDQKTKAEFEKLRSNLLSKQGQWIYFNHNLKIYEGRTTYFVKPRQRLCWLKSQALLDADEFIAEKLTFSGANS